MKTSRRRLSAGPERPLNPNDGDLWFDTIAGRLQRWTAERWHVGTAADYAELGLVDLRAGLQTDEGVYARYGAEYLRCGPAHLTPETCAAIERHLNRRSA
jgi:hypothetical protein